MAYARFGSDGSDVYVFRSTRGGYECCGCPRIGQVEDPRFETPGEMADHLEADRAAGYNVPQYAIDRLRKEAAE